MKGAAAASPPASRPFEFTGCIELREILGRRARDERELMEEIEGAPAESIYYHTDSVFLRREHVRQNFLITRHLREYISIPARLVA
jgi:Family of unknown function (DUF5752)